MLNVAIRTARTYVAMFAGLLLAAWGPLINVSTIRACAVAAVPAALTFLVNALEVKTPVKLGPRG